MLVLVSVVTLLFVCLCACQSQDIIGDGHDVDHSVAPRLLKLHLTKSAVSALNARCYKLSFAVLRERFTPQELRSLGIPSTAGLHMCDNAYCQRIRREARKPIVSQSR